VGHSYRNRHDAKVAAGNLLEGNRHKPDYRSIPTVAFTIPPIVAVGLSEVDARKQGLKFRMQVQKVPDWFTARQAAEPVYGFKVLVEEGTDRVLGAHLVGPHNLHPGRRLKFCCGRALTNCSAWFVGPAISCVILFETDRMAWS
jgi:pyruvate/2-oxoglutarate dehydrogenase complex dihydrolipoamide dehydrogenase (E3) component